MKFTATIDVVKA